MPRPSDEAQRGARGGPPGEGTPLLTLERRDGELRARLFVHVHAGARVSALAGRHGDALSVLVAAPPEGGRANRALLELVAEELGVPKTQVRIVSGHKGRRKLVEVVGADPEVLERLGRGLGPLALASRRRSGDDGPR